MYYVCKHGQAPPTDTERPLTKRILLWSNLTQRRYTAWCTVFLYHSMESNQHNGMICPGFEPSHLRVQFRHIYITWVYPVPLECCPGDMIQLTVCIERKYYSCPCHVYFISLCYTRQNHSVYVIIEFIHAFQLCKFTLFNRIIKPTFPQMYTCPLQALCFYSSLDVNNSNYVRNVLRRVHYT